MNKAFLSWNFSYIEKRADSDQLVTFRFNDY